MLIEELTPEGILIRHKETLTIYQFRMKGLLFGTNPNKPMIVLHELEGKRIIIVPWHKIFQFEKLEG
jgi:hypothetical protein